MRSTIGTLWPVSELVTASIIHRYRAELAAGARADRALASSQVWWRDEGLTILVHHLERLPPVEAISRYWQDVTAGQSGVVEVDVGNLATMLGPVADADAGSPMPARDLQRLKRFLGSPVAWGGYRCSGVCERRPSSAWDPSSVERPLTEPEERELDELVARAKAPPPSFVGSVEHELRSFCTAEVQTPAPDTALSVARLYQARPISMRAHNIVCALAWLAEARAATGLDDSTRTALLRESAICWIELVMLDSPHPALLASRWASAEMSTALRHARQRVEQLTLLVDQPLHWLVRALELALERRAGREELNRLVDEAADACSQWLAAPQLPTTSSGVLEDPAVCRAFTAWCTVLSFAPGRSSAPLRRAASALFRRLDSGMLRRGFTIDELVLIDRLASASLRLAEVIRVEPPLPSPPDDRLTPGELAARTMRRLGRLVAQPHELAGDAASVFSASLGQLEVAAWDHPNGSGRTMLLSTGGVDTSYFHILDGYLEGHAVNSDGSEQFASSAIASLHYACDLRLLFWRRLQRVRAHMPARLPIHEPFGALEFSNRYNSLLLSQLTAIAGFPLTIETPAGSLETCTGALDPFTTSRDRVRAGIHEMMASPGEYGPSPDGPSLWLLAHFVSHREPHAKVLAFDVVREVEGRRYAMEEFWKSIEDVIEGGSPPESPDQGVMSFWRLVEPLLSLEQNQQRLQDIQPGHCLLGLYTTSISHRVIAVALWHDGEKLASRMYASEPGVAVAVAGHVARLVHPAEQDFGHKRGLAGERHDRVNALCDLLAPVLDEVLGPALKAPDMRLTVVAPGRLRTLPLLGIAVQRTPLFARVSDVIHLPALGWPVSRPPDPGPAVIACWHESIEPRVSDPYGAAIIAGLRRWFPPRFILEQPDYRGDETVEALKVEEAAAAVSVTRLYGSGYMAGMTDASAGLDLHSGRAFIDNNLLKAQFQPGSTVELWAATSGPSEQNRVQESRGDRIPGLARACPPPRAPTVCSTSRGRFTTSSRRSCASATRSSVTPETGADPRR